MKIIILGDKYQKGSKSQGCAGLIKINSSSTIIQNQFSVLKQYFPKAEIIYIYGFDSKKLMIHKEAANPSINFIYNDQYETYNECFSLSLAKDYLDSETLILSGYNIFSTNCFKNFIAHESQVFSDQSGNSKIGCVANNGIVENIFYDLDNKIHSVFYLDQKTSLVLKKLLHAKGIYNAFLFEAINSCISIGCPFHIQNLPAKSIKHNKTINTKHYEKY